MPSASSRVDTKKTIDVGALAIETKISVTQVVDEEHDNVWLVSGIANDESGWSEK